MTQQGYNSHEHLIQIKGKDGQVKDYLPANWRLHELRVTCPTATIESEIVHMNEEKNFVIIKAIIYDGKTYEESARRASSMKQGMLSALDKVETGAKSRAARDFGIGTEFALEAEPEEDLELPTAQPTRIATKKAPSHNGHQEAQLTYSDIYREGGHKGMWTRQTFYATASALLDGIPVNAENVKSLSQEHLHKLQRDIERYQPEQKAG